MRPGNSRLAACLPPCPGHPAKRTLLCTGRPFKQWFPVAGGRTGNTPRHQSGHAHRRLHPQSPPGGLLSPVVAESRDIGTFSWPRIPPTASRPPQQRTRGPRGLACGYFVSPCGSRKACDLAGPCVAPVIHFSTATLVHSCGEADQRVYVNHPQAYTQDVTLSRPRAGVIGASSHAGPGFLCARSGQRRPCPDRTLIMPLQVPDPRPATVRSVRAGPRRSRNSPAVQLWPVAPHGAAPHRPG